VMGRTTRFHSDKAPGQRRKEGKEVAAPDGLRDDWLARFIDGVNVKHMLGQIETNSGDRRKINSYFAHGRCSCGNRLDNDTSLAAGSHESIANQSAVHTIRLTLRGYGSPLDGEFIPLRRTRRSTRPWRRIAYLALCFGT